MKNVPVLLVYSNADEDVSSTDFIGLKNVLGQESMAHTFDNGNHVSIYESNQNEYNKLIASFIKKD